MLRIMAHENMEEWKSNAAIAAETLRARLEAYADGKIDLGKVDTGEGIARRKFSPRIRCSVGIERDCPYTKLQLAVFLETSGR